jgi:hypothetical protein
MVVMDSVSARDVAALSVAAAHRSGWYDHAAQAEDYIKASNNSYFSQMPYHSMTHHQHGKHDW